MLPNERDEPLFEAIKRNDSEALNLALKHGGNANGSVACRNFPPPLYDACMRGRENMVRILLDAGANARSQWTDPCGAELAATTVACEEGHLSVVQMLIHHDRDLLEMSNKYGWTPLYYASVMGRTEVCRFLLECGCNVHATATDGTAALTVAAERDKLEVVRLILGAGVEVDACGDEKRMALHYAARCGRMDVTLFFMPAPNRSKIGS